MTSKVVLATLLLLWTVVCRALPAHAQMMPYKEFWLQSYSKLGRELINDEILPAIRQSLSVSESAKTGNVRVVVPHSFNPYETYATVEGDRPTVYISGFLIQMMFMSFEAYGLEEFFYRKHERYYEYVDYMMRETRRNIDAMKTGSPTGPVERYWDFIKVGMDDRKKLEGHPRFREFLSYSLIATRDALAFVVGHELGHIAHDHLQKAVSHDSDKRRAIERQADKFATKVLLAAKYHPMAAGPLFLMLGMFDQDPAGFSKSDLYDRPWCRAFLLGLEDYKALLKQHGAASEQVKEMSQIADIAKGSQCKNL